MILKGDCIEVMKAMKSNSVDAIVTDPPYGLGFMNKEWDNPSKERELIEREKKRSEQRFKEGKSPTTAPFSQSIRPGLPIKGAKEGKWFQIWCEEWLIEAYRVLKPGGSMLVMGGTRTSHRLACAIEDSGFIIKDTLMWIYGSGFPKAQDLGKMIDKRAGLKIENKSEFIGVSKLQDNTKAIKRYKACTECGKPLFGPDYCHCEWRTKSNNEWSGFKVGGIKPAYEPIIWAVKPPEGSYVDNVLKHGVGAVNVDECRINGQPHHNEAGRPSGEKSFTGKGEPTYTPNKGRFPANIILSHHPECVQVGMKKVRANGGTPEMNRGNTPVSMNVSKGKYWNHADKDGLETVESWDCHPDCAVRMLDEQSGECKTGGRNIRTNCGRAWYKQKVNITLPIDNGSGASRFFYCAKASRSERNAGLEGMEKKEAFNYGHKENPGRVAPKKSYPRTNNHPTVKPIKLFEWLIRLVTREGQIILDPFIGSGTTAIAAHNAGRKCIGIEKEGEYIEIARRRAAHWRSRPRQLEMIGG